MPRTSLSAALLCLALVACSREEPPHDQSAYAGTSPAAPTSAPTPSPERASRYTSLEDCELVRRSGPGEGDFSDHTCPGLAGYRILFSEDDLRQNLTITPPDGPAQSLKLSEVTQSGGFSRLGNKAEWRGRMDNGILYPDAMILRYRVVEHPETPDRETSYLLTVALTPKPCVTAKVSPAADQNEQARRIADGPMRCL